MRYFVLKTLKVSPFCSFSCNFKDRWVYFDMFIKLSISNFDLLTKFYALFKLVLSTFAWKDYQKLKKKWKSRKKCSFENGIVTKIVLARESDLLREKNVLVIDKNLPNF